MGSPKKLKSNKIWVFIIAMFVFGAMVIQMPLFLSKAEAATLEAANTGIEDSIVETPEIVFDTNPIVLYRYSKYSSPFISLADHIASIKGDVRVHCQIENTDVVNCYSFPCTLTTETLKTSYMYNTLKPGSTYLVLREESTNTTTKIPLIVKNAEISGPSVLTIYQLESVDFNKYFSMEPKPASNELSFLRYSPSDTSALSPALSMPTNSKFDAKQVGTVILNVALDEITSRVITVNIIPPTYSVKWTGKASYTVVMGDKNTEDLENIYQLTISPNYKVDISASSSNTSIAEVGTWVTNGVWINPKSEGRCTIAISIGAYRHSFTVVVKPRLLKAAPLPQQNIAFDNAISINNLNMDDYTKQNLAKIQIWRSTKKNGKYQLVKTIKWENYSWPIKDRKKLKPNKAYYYKVRYLSKGAKTYGAFSVPTKYWTAPKRKVSNIKRSGKYVSWSKVRGAKGYIITDGYCEFEGYNIFFQRVYFRWDITKPVKKPHYTLRWDECKLERVTPYAKHGKYYYAHHESLVTKISKFKDEDMHKWAS